MKTFEDLSVLFPVVNGAVWGSWVSVILGVPAPISVLAFAMTIALVSPLILVLTKD